MLSNLVLFDAAIGNENEIKGRWHGTASFQGDSDVMQHRHGSLEILRFIS